ncbi:heme ABC transporter ATP-binding protein [Natrononativus amylolyticus]|uniref:heme ABC transporter ATP-binding protein n=1 Tax=Natrononativus amylolyticus TaxID=2963434 RepID=UPI0020CEDFA7|nr:heme ABC transporter ATP-binding protein [Natrononativus amylolyticus]
MSDPVRSDEATIDVDRVSHSFGDVSVLEDVSMTADAGEFVGLIGPNGAGKTTLLRTISAALEPASGTVAVDGADVHGLSAAGSSRLVAVVPQDTALSFSFPVRDVVEMGRHPHRSRFAPPTNRDRAQVDRALERTRTSTFADRGIDEISGGERQRVLLARAIAQETPVLLLDEPTASLDVNHQIETLELVDDLVDDGRTAVAAIHDLNLAARYCDRLVLLAGGRVAADGAPEDVLTPGALETAFDAAAAVTDDPVTGTVSVTALPRPEGRALPDRVHVLGSGSTAAAVLSRLSAGGVDASAGPVPDGGSVATAALRCDRECLTVEPFAPLSAGARDAAADRIREADVVVLADLELAAGNQLLLETVADVDALVAVERHPLEDRNFAGEAARRRYETLRSRALEAEPADVLEAVAAAAGSSVDSRRESRSPPPDEPAADD